MATKGKTKKPTAKQEAADVPPQSRYNALWVSRDPCSASLEISLPRPTPSFTQGNGCTLHIVGVGDNRIGTLEGNVVYSIYMLDCSTN
jgi:hypothetical protein